jgi:hypothetical protein
MADKKDEGKTPVVSTIIAALCVTLYIGGLSYGALSIYNSVSERRALADREFDNLAGLVSTMGVLGFMDEPFIKAVQDSIDGSQTVLGVVITSSRGEFAFEKERGTVIDWTNDSPRFIPRFAVTNPPKYLPLRIEGQRNVNIQAVCGYVDYDYCIGVLKRTLLIVLFSLTLAFFTLLMDTLLVKNRESGGREPGDRDKNTDKDTDKNTGNNTGKKQAAESPPARTAPAGEKTGKADDGEAPREGEARIPDDWMPPDDDEEDDSTDETPDFDFNSDNETPDLDDDGDDEEPDFDFNGGRDDETPDAGDEKDEKDEKDEDAGREAGTPRGLFSPRGGIGWEAYTGERLESELRRCAAAEQDLATIIIRVREPEKLGDAEFRLFCEEAVQYFEHRDLIFEYREQGALVICPGLGLDQAFAKSEEFNNRVLGKIARAAGSNADLRFGISSRSGRLINAERITLEAAEALKKAAGDPESHIVAFKSDPEKYRQYLAGRATS